MLFAVPAKLLLLTPCKQNTGLKTFPGPVFQRDFLGALWRPRTAPGVGSLFASEIGGLVTAPMTIPLLYEGLKTPGYTPEQ